MISRGRITARFTATLGRPLADFLTPTDRGLEACATHLHPRTHYSGAGTGLSTFCIATIASPRASRAITRPILPPTRGWRTTRPTLLATAPVRHLDRIGSGRTS